MIQMQTLSQIFFSELNKHQKFLHADEALLIRHFTPERGYDHWGERELTVGLRFARVSPEDLAEGWLLQREDPEAIEEESAEFIIGDRNRLVGVDGKPLSDFAERMFRSGPGAFENVAAFYGLNAPILFSLTEVEWDSISLPERACVLTIEQEKVLDDFLDQPEIIDFCESDGDRTLTDAALSLGEGMRLPEALINEAAKHLTYGCASSVEEIYTESARLDLRRPDPKNRAWEELRAHVL